MYYGICASREYASVNWEVLRMLTIGGKFLSPDLLD